MILEKRSSKTEQSADEVAKSGLNSDDPTSSMKQRERTM